MQTGVRYKGRRDKILSQWIRKYHASQQRSWQENQNVRGNLHEWKYHSKTNNTKSN